MTVDELWPHVHDAPNFKSMCRTLNDLGVLGLPASIKRPIARELCGKLGFEPSDLSFEDTLRPGRHTAERVEKNRATSKENQYQQKPQHRFSRTLLRIRHRNKTRHGVHHPAGGLLDDYIAAVWEDAHRPNHPWAGVIDPTAFGDKSAGESGGSPFALSFDRLDCRLGYVPGNVQLVPNAWNKTVMDFGEAHTAELAHAAVRGNVGDANPATPETWIARTSMARTRLEAYFMSAFGNSGVFYKHPNLLLHKAEMIAKFSEALARGRCEVTGLPFVYQPNHPQLPSWDLIDPSKSARGHSSQVAAGKRGTYHKFTFSGGSETPADMRLVCRFVNLGMATWGEGPWWVVARRAAELHEAGWFTSRDS